MSLRNLSPSMMFEQMAREHVPEARFSAATASDAATWQSATLPRVLDTLGRLPGRVPPNPQLLAEWHEADLVRQKWLIDVGPHIAATMLVNYPASAREEEPLPAILCWHGHGEFGKTNVMSNGPRPDVRESIARANYNFGFQMARRGFVTFAIDWMGRGDRDDNKKPNNRPIAGDRDWCNLYYLHATMLGMTTLGINVVHGMAATDVMSDHPMVNPDRIGVMGISGGGTMALWSALCDDRIKATEIICYSDLWEHFGFRDINYCGSQVTPGLYRLVDLPDLQGLLAPRPLLVDIGADDDCFLVDTAMECYRQVAHIYDISGHPDRLDLDLHSGGHAWGGNKSEAFFNAYLGA